MMKTIKKDKIEELLDFLAERYRLFAPVPTDETDVIFAEVKQSEQVRLDFYNSRQAPKELFFPQSQRLFSYSKDAGPTVMEPKEKRQRVIFGLRPCDANSLTILDKVFDGPDYKDPYYIERRKNTIIFSLACNSPQSNCFCTSLSSGPFSRDGTDAFVADLGDKYFFEAVTPAGERIIKEMPQLQEAQDKDIIRREELQAEAEAKIAKKVELDNLPEELADMFDNPIWSEIHQKCLGCGVCTYLCPTCHCFDILDEEAGGESKRIRIWDSCMYPCFTLEASGHNPRPTGKQRMRQRIMHKFNYFVENYGQFACVGCGRCLRNCPVNMDITRAIEAIKNAR